MAHVECAAGIPHIPSANKALSSRMCIDLYTNPVIQLHSWSQDWTGCVSAGHGEPSGTTVAEDLESLDKDALILKLKQVGVALYEPYNVIWSSLIALQQLRCNTCHDMISLAMVFKAVGSGV